MEPAHTIQSPPSSTTTHPTHCPEDWGDNREYKSCILADLKWCWLLWLVSMCVQQQTTTDLKTESIKE